VKQKFSDKNILELLSNLKNTENNYPSEMIQSRRDLYKKQAAAMAVLMKAAGNGTIAGDGRNANSGPASLGTFLEIALVIMIVVEAGVAAYIYRDQIADFIDSTLSPKVEDDVNPPKDSTSTPVVLPAAGEELDTATPAPLPIATPTITVTVIDTVIDAPSATPLPTLVPEGLEDTQGANDQVQSTPPPPRDNPGNHYGNTPKPERTKDSNNNSSDDKDKQDKDKKK
jgi:hypothetical protein